MKKLLLLVLYFTIGSILYGQDKPKLVVGIIVDQMRQDYLFRFYDDFGNDGLKRLMDGGFFYRNNKYIHVPTKTGPGHASIYTGTTPARHGIIGNEWYERSIKRDFNCVEDTTWNVVGGISNGQVSPANVLTTTITDELRLFYNFKSKVISVSLKDRSATIPGGHNPTGAYWYDLQSGNMITSTYYMDQLPDWVVSFNNKKRAQFLLKQIWEPIAEKSVYDESISDRNEYEQEIRKGTGSSFPYDLSKFKDDYDLLKYTPFTNTLTNEFVIEAVKAENLGKDEIPDFLTISYSATDDIGHKFGPRSMEIQDTYLRLDREIGQLLSFLDQEIGRGEYLLFLSADHGVTDVPSYLRVNKMPSGYHNNGYFKNLINENLSKKYGEGLWVERIINEQVYLDRKLIEQKQLPLETIQNETAKILLKEKAVTEAFSAETVSKRMFTDPNLILLQNGYHTKRSGDVLYILANSSLNDQWSRKGTDHRTNYTYDRHIPLIFYGKGISNGQSFREITPLDITPTLAMILNISLPSGCIGQPLLELLK